MFSILSMLLLNAILLLTRTLRDILMFRMKGFASSFILSILSDTLITMCCSRADECNEEGLRRSQTSSETVFEFEFDKVLRQHCLV
jgi:hypothetical protein